jgi:hypothetical protein
MPALLLKIAMSMLASLMTEKVLKQTAVIALRYVAKRTKNTEDDEMAEVVAEAWEVK